MIGWDPIAVAVVLAMAIVASTAYISGRVHERSRQYPERRFAYCQGYDRASSAMLANTPADRGDLVEESLHRSTPHHSI